MKKLTNGLESRTWLYIFSTVVAGGALSGVAAWLHPISWDQPLLLWMAAVSGLVLVARLYPFKLSPQVQASVFTAPLFMGVLTLPPVGAVLAGVVATLLAEAKLRLAPRVILFNIGVYSTAASLSGMAYQALLPGDPAASLGAPSALPAVLAGGAILHLTNLTLVAGIVTIRKGTSFWRQWKDTWAIDVVQEAGFLVLAYLGALLWLQAWWAVLLLTVPVILAYYAFRRSVMETERNAKLAEDNASLAKRLEASLKELQEAQSQLIESAKLASVGVLAAGVAHEVNNPMFAISGRAELLLRHPERYFKAEKAVEYVKSIHQLSNRVSAIVKELLEYSRPSVILEPVKVSDAMDVALDLVGKLATAKGVAIQREYRETPRVHSAANQLQQVFVNLILNAVDATPSGGGITLRCYPDGDHVLASVKDTGIGIAEDVLPRVFEPFFTTKEVGRGTGLGLYICRKILTDYQGQITIHSKEGQGTEVVVKLPAMKVVELEQAMDSVSVSVSEVQRREGR